MFLLLLFGLAICVFTLDQMAESQETSWVKIFAFLFFATWPLVSLWTLIRPFRLTLDSDGFELSGGTSRKSTKILWSQTEPFFVKKIQPVRTFGLVKMIGFNFKPDYQNSKKLRGVSRMFGAEAGLPMLWSFSGSTEQMVIELNQYRDRALTI